jgi:hypothetical protein
MVYLRPGDREYRVKFDTGVIKFTQESMEKIEFLSWVETIGDKYGKKFPFRLRKSTYIVDDPSLFDFNKIEGIILSQLDGPVEYFFCQTTLKFSDQTMLPFIEIVSFNYSPEGKIECIDSYQLVELIINREFIFFTNDQLDTMIRNGINPMFLINFNCRFLEVSVTRTGPSVHNLRKFKFIEYDESYRGVLTGNYER